MRTADSSRPIGPAPPTTLVSSGLNSHVAGLELELRPLDPPLHAHVEVDSGAGLLQVHDLGEVHTAEAPDGREVVAEHRDGADAGEAGVDPARERDDQNRVA